MDQRETPKRLRVDSTVSGDTPVQLYEITVEPSQQGDPRGGDYDRCLLTDLNQPASVDGLRLGRNLPLTLIQTVDGGSRGENSEVVVLSECPAAEGQDELVDGITAAILTQGHGLLADAVEDVTVTADHGPETQVIAYFETIPNVLPCDSAARFTFSPDTVMSSALSSTPITSTLPIVSKHVPASPTPLVLAVDTDGEDVGDGASEEDVSLERQDHQLEEHW